ncbi:hypothetical protein AAHA92_09786 [Salvia divinorum]|uniref:Uncharacterized protein n=1 Tax=Salvia divinorum TaxID=28513 RepID=A0ABD1HTD3_SALDI
MADRARQKSGAIELSLAQSLSPPFNLYFAVGELDGFLSRPPAISLYSTVTSALLSPCSCFAALPRHHLRAVVTPSRRRSTTATNVTLPRELFVGVELPVQSISPASLRHPHSSAHPPQFLKAGVCISWFPAASSLSGQPPLAQEQ